ncbi:MAG: hypothetical protein ABSD68_01275 [Candidatus Micrarchaeales archaeon]|jgi:hypothetical protein
METGTKTIKAPKFKEIRGTTLSLFVLDLKVDDPTSMRLLDEAGLRQLEDIEILPILAKDEELREQLKGKRFRVTGQVKKDGLFAIHNGKLTKGKGTDVENTVHVDLDGGNPQLLDVLLDYDVKIYKDYRYKLLRSTPYTRSSWYNGEQLILGVPKDENLQAASAVGIIEIKMTGLRKEATEINAEIVKLRKLLRKNL